METKVIDSLHSSAMHKRSEENRLLALAAQKDLAGAHLEARSLRRAASVWGWSAANCERQLRKYLQAAK